MEIHDYNVSKYGPIISVCLELSDRCKVGCPYCLLEEKRQEVSKERMFDIIRTLNDYGVVRYTIGGGEPLDIPYVYEIGKFVKNLSHNVLLRTSACNYMNFKIVKESFDLVDISIDSCKKETMKKCKPNINSEMVFQNIKNFSENHITYRCNILITQYNFNDVLPTIMWLAENGVRDIRIQKLVRRGKAKEIFTNINVSDDEYYDLLKEIFARCSYLNINVTEVKSVNSQTLCIVKPNGELYVGTSSGIIRIGEVFNIDDLNEASRLIYSNQKKVYNDIKIE